MSDATSVSEPGADLATCQSPPAAAQPPRADPDPRDRLNELARELARTHNRRLITEYLRLRRAIR